MNEAELLKSLLGNGPWAAVAYFLGRQLIKAWDQDREQLRTIAQQTLTAITEFRTELAAIRTERQ